MIATVNERKKKTFSPQFFLPSSPDRNICLCHVCSEIRDVWKKTGAWFYKGFPTFDSSGNPSKDGDSANGGGGGSSCSGHQMRDQNVSGKRVPKTTKLGMEIESDDDDDEMDANQKEENQRIFKNGSFSSSFLRSRNLFNLRLSTDTTSRLTIDNGSTLSLPKKSPVTPYSRQTSSSDSQKSANSLQPQMFLNDMWDSATANSQRRTNSISSCYSITESMANESVSMSQSQSKCAVNITIRLFSLLFFVCLLFSLSTHSFIDFTTIDYRDTVNLCLGWLEVSITFDESQDTLFCILHRARDIPAMDSAGLSDPFCKLNLITPENNIRYTRWQKSRIAHKTNNPEFNETFTFLGMSKEDMEGSALYIVILDDDKYGNDFLGAARVPLGPVYKAISSHYI